MSKKTAKKAARKRPAKSRKKAAPRRSATSREALAAAPSNRTAVATIFVYDVGAGQRVRTSPQLLTCGPGFIEWTVVNLSSDAMPDVDISWPAGSPWGGAPIKVKNGNARVSLEGARAGRFKYNVTCNGFTEDPEVEYPEQ